VVNREGDAEGARLHAKGVSEMVNGGSNEVMGLFSKQWVKVICSA